MLDVKENAGAFSLAGKVRSQARVLHNRGKIIKPIHISRRDIEAQKIMFESLERRVFEIIQRRLQLRFGEGAGTPAFAHETARSAGAGGATVRVGDVENGAVERHLLHLGDVSAHERGIRLVPAEFDELLRLCGSARSNDRKNEHNENNRSGHCLFASWVVASYHCVPP